MLYGFLYEEADWLRLESEVGNIAKKAT